MFDEVITTPPNFGKDTTPPVFFDVFFIELIVSSHKT